MLDKKILLLLADEGGDEQGGGGVEHEAFGTRVLRFESEGDCKLTSLILRGAHDIAHGRRYPGIGYLRSDGGYSLDIRIHGTSFLDGHELVRLMAASNSPAYGGEQDTDHFIYVADADSSYTVVSYDHMMLPITPCTIKMIAEPSESVTGKLIPGLQYESTSGVLVAVSGSASTDGTVPLSGKTPAATLFHRFMHNPTKADMLLPIAYDSVHMTEGNYATDDTYDGQALSYDLGDCPLLGDYDSDLYDVLDCMSGTLTKHFGGMRLRGEDITEAVYMGIPCFRIMLPEVAADGRVTVGEYRDYGLDYFLEFEEALLLSPTRDSLYITLFEDTTLDDARAELDGALVTYTLETPKVIDTGVRIDPLMRGQLHYIEVCSTIDTEINISYKETE